MRLTRRGRLTVTLGVSTLLVAAACTTYAVTRTPVGPALGLDTGPPCSLAVAGSDHRWTREQAMTATTVAAVGQRIGATDNGVAAAIGRALRPAAGQTDGQSDGADDGAADGAADGADGQVGDRVVDAAAARQVYRTLPDRARPGRTALALAAALLGRAGPALTCTVPAVAPGAGVRAQPPGPTGLTVRAEDLRAQMRAVFDKQILGGFAPGGVTGGHIAGSAHYEGRAIDVFLRPVTATNTQRGWLQAQWAVAHADRLQLATVIFDRRIWSAARSPEGWRRYEHPGGPTENPVLLHEDHLHLDVLEGGVAN